MAVVIQSQIFNPVTGVFGTGQIQFFFTSGTWYVPPGIGRVRVRMWGGGGGTNVTSIGASYNIAGSGAGFALKAIYDLAGVTSIAVTVGAGGQQNTSAGGTSSFGSYCSATGGQTGVYGANIFSGGTGIGGDINNTGGTAAYSTSTYSAGGGAASIFGNGGRGYYGSEGASSLGGAGGGGGGTGFGGGNGFLGTGYLPLTTNGTPLSATTGIVGNFSIDFLATGGGGGGQTNNLSGMNGGGGGANSPGGFPGGGNGYNYGQTSPAGLVIVEW
jgi:hypothetical protein